MSMSQGLTIVTTPELVLPKQYLQLVYGKFPTFMGSAYALNDGKPEVVVSTTDDALPPVDEWLKVLEENKGQSIMMHFINSKTKFTTESEQPFVTIKDEAGTILAVACMEGEYFKADADSPHTDEYHVMNEVLGPQLRKIYTKMCGGDLQKFEEELKDPDTEKLINSLSGARGVVVLFTALGTVFKFEKGNTLGGEYPWGWVSNKLGFVEQSSQDTVIPKKEAAPEVKRGLLAKFTSSSPKETPVIADTVSITDQQKATTIAAENALSKATLQLIAPPTDLVNKGLSRVKGWYDKHTTGKDLNNVKLTDDQMKKGSPAVATDAWMAQNAGKKKEIDDKIAAARDGYKPFVPIIEAKLRVILNELLDSGPVKAITDKGKILSPEELKAAPKIAPFSAQIGRDLLETFRWDDEIMLKFIDTCKKHNDMTPLILLFREYRDELMKFMVDVKPEKKDDVKEDVTKETPSVTTPTTPSIKPKGGLLAKFTKTAA